MRECIFFLCLWCGIIGGAEAVSPGIQHFDRYRSLLEGKKVGIVANQTAVLETGDGYKHSVDFLRDHQVQLIRYLLSGTWVQRRCRCWGNGG